MGKGLPAYSDSVRTAKKCHCKQNVTVTGVTVTVLSPYVSVTLSNDFQYRADGVDGAQEMERK